LASPAYGLGQRAAEVADVLRRFRASGHHEFWREATSLCDDTLFRLAHIQGHRQFTDVYLLGLAVRMNGRLATFDRSIPVAAALGATPDHLAVIGA
jgi:predicted nucleic acid-binding protein